MPRDDGPEYVTCPECNGMGTMGRGDTEEDCWACSGAGISLESEADSKYKQTMYSTAEDSPERFSGPICQWCGSAPAGENDVCDDCARVHGARQKLGVDEADRPDDEYPDVGDTELDLMEVPPTPDREIPVPVGPDDDVWGPPKKKDIGRSNEGVTFDKFIDDILIKEGAQVRRLSRKEEETGQRKRAKMGREHAHNRIRYTGGSK
jgi:hypothetical protein